MAQDNLIPAGYDPRATGGSGPNGNPAGTPPGYDASAVGAQSYGPTSPTPPTNPARPVSWPGGPPIPAAQRTVGPPQPEPPPPTKDPLEPPIEPATILARVGSEVVQASELLPTVHQTIDAYIENNLGERFHKMPQHYQRETINSWQRDVLEKTLEDAISIKLLLAELKGAAPEEAVSKNIERIRAHFNQHEIKRLMSVYKATSTVDLDNKLRAQGGSLESQRAVFVDRSLAVGWVRQEIREQKEPSHEQMVAYYREHLAEWERPARARWEQLTAKFSEFPSEAAAWQAVAHWGNLVQRGAPFAQVAKAHSQGVSAEEGGLNDWTTQGSLRSTVIDRALFSLPVGALSPILTDDDGVHIIRVVEREERHTIPFSEVQAEIKEKLHRGDKQAQVNEYIAKLRERIPVHTVFDDESSPLAKRSGQAAR